MAAPNSAQQLPMQTPNTSAPLTNITVDLSEQTVFDGLGKQLTGKLMLTGYISAAWRYLLGTFAQTSASISRSFSLTAGAAYSQTQMQQLIDQVKLLSKQVGGSP